MGFVGDGSGHPANHASKGAVCIFTKMAAARYRPDGIRANSVQPGYPPPMLSPNVSLDPSGREEKVRFTRLSRTGEVKEVANDVLFLASDDALLVTGTKLIIDRRFFAQ